MITTLTDKEFDDLHTAFTGRVRQLTGEEWCPYPSRLMMEVTMVADDDVAINLIIRRRTFSFPNFLFNEPMLDELLSIVAEAEDKRITEKL